MRNKLIGAALAVGLALALALASAAPASAASAGVTALFNTPNDNLVIQNTTKDLINAAPAGSYIRMAMYHLSMASIGDALTAAHARGVHVQMVLDKSAFSAPVVAKLAALLGANPDGTDFVVLYSPTGALMHDKFILFSNPMAVVDATANFTASHLWNSAIVTRRHARYYKSYTTRFALLAHKTAGSYTTTQDGQVQSYFFPQPTSDDAWVGFLKGVTAKGSRIDIAMYNFTDQNLADKLNHMAAHGAHIRIAFTTLTVSLSSKIAKHGYPANAKVYVHAKELIVHGTYAGSGGNYQLWLGSTNFTHTGLHKNADNTTRVSGKATWTLFEANFKKMFA